MKDQVTILMEALRLVQLELEMFKRQRKYRDGTLNAIEAILNDPKVAAAIQSLEPLVDAPSLVPEQVVEKEGVSH
jgi:hypothetical protein